MWLEKWIPYIVQNNLLIIQALTVVIMLGGAFLVVRGFQSSKERHLTGSSAEISNDSFLQLEESLKKIVEKASLVSASAAHSTGSGASTAGGSDAAPLLNEIEKLKDSLAQKQSMIEEMKTQVASVANGGAGTAAAAAGAGASVLASMSDEVRGALDAQIKDLQARLSEYEIISEDIADLSRYKDENQKLQTELANLKTAPSTAAPVATPVAEQATAPKGPDLVVEGGVEDDLMAQFAAAVEAQKSGSLETQSDIDVDRIVAEASGLSDIAVTENVNALEEEINPEQLAKEADLLVKVNPEDQKLMGEFESFMKKGSS